jgi:UDP-N-acetylglucosamine 2-epimerase (non-hydrolysing)
VLRQSTERPEAVESGYATVVGTAPEAVARAIIREVKTHPTPEAPSPYGDGNAGRNIARIVLEANS